MAKQIKSFKEAVESINALNKKWTILSFGDPSSNLRRLPMYDMPIDLTTLGGLPYGQVITGSGVEHSGKSSFFAAMMARYQEENPDKVCIWVDAENTLLTQGKYFHDDYGLNYDENCFLRFDTTGLAAEEIFEKLILLQSFDQIGMIVIDSSKALISAADLDNDFTKDNGQRASIAKSMGKFIKMMVQYTAKKGNILAVINQVTVEKEMFSTTYTESGGYSLKYFPSLKIRFGTRTFTYYNTKELKTDLSANKAQTAEYVDKVNGMQFHYVVVKNRLNKMTNAGGFITVEFGKGIKRAYDFIQVIDAAGILLRPTTQSVALTDPVTGEIIKNPITGAELIFKKDAEVEAFLEQDKEFFRQYYTRVLDFLCGNKQHLNLLDESIINELNEQEAQIMKDIPTEADALLADGIEDNE